MLSKLILVSVGLSIISFFYRNPQTEIVDNIYSNINSVYFFNEEFLFQDNQFEPYANTLNTYDDLANASDKIVRFTPISREQFVYTFFTKCKVIEEFKSSLSYNEKEIYITETAYIENYDTYDLKVMGFITLMKYDQEYVVYLKNNGNFDKGYYYPVSNIFGIIPLKESLSINNEWNQDTLLNKADLYYYDIIYNPDGSNSIRYQSCLDDYSELFKITNEMYGD